MVGGSNFIRYKLTRLCHKFRDVRDSSGSQLQATAFILLLIVVDLTICTNICWLGAPAATREWRRKRRLTLPHRI